MASDKEAVPFLRGPPPPLPPRTREPLFAPERRLPPPLPPRAQPRPGPGPGPETVTVEVPVAAPSATISSSLSSPPPPPYSEEDPANAARLQPGWVSHDVRSTSTQSLLPQVSEQGGRRTLLLVYIHGFCGNEMSFQSFPAHVHNLLSLKLADSHIVHTKIYPKYKSRRPIEFATEEFSKWLEPHESSNTDVILLGHSMGGILSAEVVLLPPREPTPGRPFRHNILGTVNLDVPFLGLHPGVISSGISSLFSPAPAPSGQENEPSAQSSRTDLQAESSTSLSPAVSRNSDNISDYTSSQLHVQTSGIQLTESLPEPTISDLDLPTDDPNYNPPFQNDVLLPTRGGWESALHFVMKHYSEGITQAMQRYIKSHLEFGSCLMDYSGMLDRYSKIRALEHSDERSRSLIAGIGPPTPRVRFVNFYTACTGRPKKSASSLNPSQEGLHSESSAVGEATGTQTSSLRDYDSRSPSVDRAISLADNETAPSAPSTLTTEDHESSDEDESENEFHDAMSEPEIEMTMLNPEPEPYPEDASIGEIHQPWQEESLQGATGGEHIGEVSQTGLSEDLIPPLPEEPPPFDENHFASKEERKAAQKQHDTLIKEYKQAVKNREKALKAREKEMQKLEKAQEKAEAAIRKANEKRDKEAKKEQERHLKEMLKAEQRDQKLIAKAEKEARKKAEGAQMKERKFCMLPGKVSGERDSTWVRVYMEGVDEVGAHCGLFFKGDANKRLILETCAKIEEWVNEAEHAKHHRAAETSAS